ncbi:PPE domain-containing protein [Nocardia brasiliensis]
MRKLPRTPDHPAVRRTDPAYAPTVEMFDAMTHREIHDKVALLKPAVLTGGQQSWGQAAAGLADAVAQAHTEIRAAIADGWRGSGAQNAADAVYAFEQTGQDLADVLAVVSQRLGQAGDAAEALRKAVVAPTASAPDLGAALLDPTQATTNAADQKAAEHSRQDIVRAMNDIYAGALIPTGNDVPAFLDQQSNGAADAPGSWPASKLTGADINVETPAAQQVPADPGNTEVRLGTGAATTAPATTAPDTGAEPVEEPETTTTAGAATAPATADAPAAAPTRVSTVTAGVDAPLSTAPAAVRVPGTPATAPSTATTVAASAQPVSVPSVPGSTAAAPADDQRKREERRKDSSSDAVTGLGAGAMGGLMGGALAMGDTPRPGASVAANAASTARAARFDDEDEYEDDFHFDDMPTYLEPSDEGGELIGSIDPTTPPVLGEWTELE